MARMRPESLAFTVFLGALGTLSPFGVDTALPALLDIAKELNSTVEEVSLTLSTFMAGFALAQLVFGPLSDRFGRRPVLLWGSALFTLASFLCAVAPSIRFLLIARFFEGCGAGAGMVMVFALVRDHFEGAAGRAKLSFVTLVINLAPMVAPSVGAVILIWSDWRATYAALGVGGFAVMLAAWLWLAESLLSPNRDALRLRRLVSGYAEVLRHPVAFPCVLVNGLNFGCMFAYVAGSTFTFMQLFGLSSFQYGLVFAATSVSIVAGAYSSGRMSQGGVAALTSLALGLSLSVLASLSLLILTLFNVVQWPVFVLLLSLSNFGFGLTAPNAAHGVLQPLPHIAGVAGASLGFVQMVCAALSAALVSKLADGHSPFSMTLTMALFACSAAAIFWLRVRPSARHAECVAP